MKSILKNYRQSPRKVRLVAKAVSGKSAQAAILILDFMPKRSALPLRKLIDSAVANAKSNSGISIEDLIVRSIEINKGVTLKRMRPRARGSGFPINKRTSHIVVTLESKKDKSAKEVAEMKVPEEKSKTKPVSVKKTAVKKTVTKPKTVKKEVK
jgi:large subunit ribosomal protein L22